MIKSLIENIQDEPNKFVKDAVGLVSVMVIFFVGLHLPILM
ncbi:MAG: hypothetical protein AAF826_09895 [Pseudomonadota bacterium]